MIGPPRKDKDKDADAPPPQPSQCPACSGREIVTTSKTIDVATYWRCVSCGEIWNLDRRRGQPVGRRPW
jgi:transposase-like protein